MSAKKPARSIIVVAVAVMEVLLRAAAARAQGPAYLVKDINTHTGSSNPSNLVSVDHTLSFTADEGSGPTLWTSDGTADGTVRVQNLAASELISVSGVLFFSADGALWRSAGAGANPIAVPGTDGLFPAQLTNVNGTLFFAASGGTSGFELWKSDGTETGTVRVAAINADGGANSFTAVGAQLFFIAGYVQLWTSDGTAAGTVRVTDVSLMPARLTNVDGTLFFINAYTSLWRSDGTATGTFQIRELSIPNTVVTLGDLTGMGDTLFFSVHYFSDDQTIELWRSDGTETHRVAGFFAGSQDVLNPTAMNGTLYFTARFGRGYALWRTDGSSLELIQSVESLDPLSGLTAAHGLLFFDVSLPRSQLWRSDGTPAGTVPIASFEAGGPANLTSVDGTLFFSADGGSNGRELWKSDGTEAGTVQVADINRTTLDASPALLTSLAGALFFLAGDGSEFALWRSDGTDEGTVPVIHHFSGSKLTAVNGALFYFTSDETGTVALWKSNGTAAGTQRLKELGPNVSVSDLSDLNGRIVFIAQIYANGFTTLGLWRSDGTEAGTMPIADLDRATQPATLCASPTVAHGVSYFCVVYGDTGNPASLDFRLWKSDGTAAGTVSLEMGHFSNLLNVNGLAFFDFFDQSSGRELWRSNGTANGTVRVKDIVPGSDSSHPDDLTDVDGRVFFTIRPASGADELWRSDGTEGGTARVTDIKRVGGYPLIRAAVNGTLYFTTSTPGGVVELWHTDGPEAATTRLHEFVVDGPGPTELTNVYGRLLFSGPDGSSGWEPWRSDGTEAGTARIQDIAPGSLSSGPSSFTVAGSRVFFTADDLTHGRELWAIPLSAILPACAGDCNGDYQVTVDELVRGVNIALGNPLLDQCSSLDTNMDRGVSVDELVTAVNHALNGCTAS